MNSTVILVAITAVPAVVLIILKANATQVFFALCLGYMLMQIVGQDSSNFADLFMPHAHASADVMRIGLLVIPAVFTALFTIRSISGSKFVLNALAAVCFGFLLTVLLVPLLSPHIYDTISRSNLWYEYMRLESLIIGISALVCMFSLWTQRSKKSEKGHGKHHRS